jgi:hypothetical protein
MLLYKYKARAIGDIKRVYRRIGVYTMGSMGYMGTMF